MATDVASLIELAGSETVSLLKVDIERSELAVFSRNYAKWIGRVETIVIELHDDECREVFFHAVSGQGFEIDQCDELTVCRRQSG